MCFRHYPEKTRLSWQVSAILTSARSSMSSLPGRRSSVTSVLSFAERRASFQSGRRLSNGSLVSMDKSYSVKDTKSSSANNNLLVRREVTFSPIHEHSEESSVSEMPQEHALNLTTCLDPSITIMALSEEPKAIVIITSHFKCTEV